MKTLILSNQNIFTLDKEGKPISLTRNVEYTTKSYPIGCTYVYGKKIKVIHHIKPVEFTPSKIWTDYSIYKKINLVKK